VHRCGGTIRARLSRLSRSLTYPPRVLRLSPLARASVAVVLVLLVAGSATPVAAAAPPWKQDIDEVVAGHDVSVAIGFDGGWLYRRRTWNQMTPASNQKLVFSMALLQRASIGTRIRTRLFAKGATTNGVLRGNLWIVGRGDPEVDRATMAALARAVDGAGIRKVRGRVMGATTGFQRDWWAPGWQDYFPRDYIALPTALTFEGNQDARGVHIRDPERRAARSLTKRLRALGVVVTRDAGAGAPPSGLRRIVTVASDPLGAMISRMNRRSRNFSAEVLGKWLGGLVIGGAGSIAKGARATARFAAAHGVSLVAHDSSGLSYRNRIRTQDLVKLLWFAGTRTWETSLRGSLPTGGQGTLEGRLVGVKVRAKTGTLIDISALSGWVWLEQEGAWGEFSIMSRGMSKSRAVAIEDRIVRIVANRASLGARARFPSSGAGSMLDAS
jgi:serine-type D-Ala-D-Ala carboxypeptidase/endopeptidase (penicillin-binding protein 4)